MRTVSSTPIEYILERLDREGARTFLEGFAQRLADVQRSYSIVAARLLDHWVNEWYLTALATSSPDWREQMMAPADDTVTSTPAEIFHLA